MKATAWENLPAPESLPAPEGKKGFRKKRKPTRRATHTEIAFQLRDLRRDSGFRTTREVAEEAKINVSLLHRLERGNLSRRDLLDKVWYGTAIAKLAFVYDLKPEDILTRPLEASD